jgi:ribulose-bisphosphate carboxylase small chain
MTEVLACRKAHPHAYIRVNAFDSTRGFETTRLSFIVNRPAAEPGFLLKRHEVGGRCIQYTLESYAAQAPEGRRYE